MTHRQRIGDNCVLAVSYRLWVSDDRCTFVRLWDDGRIEVARREAPFRTWEAPVWLTEELVDDRRDFAPLELDPETL